MRRKFYLFKRKNSDVYYVQFVNTETGKRGTAWSTGTADRDKAVELATAWLYEGIPSKHGRQLVQNVLTYQAILKKLQTLELTADDAEAIVTILKSRGLVQGTFQKPGAASQTLYEFLSSQWQPGSAFLADKKAYGRSMTNRYIQGAQRDIANAWNVAPFNTIPLAETTRDQIKAHLFSLADSGLSPRSCNRILTSATVVLNWAYKEKLISENPAAGIPKFTDHPKKKGILDKNELEQLIALTWKDQRAYTAFLVAATCGLRLGEVQAIQLSDIGDDRLFVRHSYSIFDGLKTTKNGESRTVPLLPFVRDALLAQAKTNPHNDAFIFWSLIPGQPLDGKVITKGFTQALATIGIDDATRKARNLSFHSLRHGYATLLSNRLPEALAAKGTGHKALEVFRHYQDHFTEEALTALSGATTDAFGSILPFKTGKKAAGI